MTLQERFAELVRACFSGIWIQSQEHEDALVEIAPLCQREDWQLAVWDVDQGFRPPAASPNTTAAQEEGAAEQDPLSVLRALPALSPPGTTGILVLQNFHHFLRNAEIIQAVAHQIHLGKQQRNFLVILSPVLQLPVELEKLFVVLEHELPGREQLLEIARAIATEEGELPAGTELERVLDAAAGLTRYEAEGAFSLSLVREGRIRPDVVRSLKTQQLKKSGLVTLHEGQERFADLGGLEALKTFCSRALRGAAPTANNGQRPTTPVKPRGILLLGVPGTGKSALAKALGQETGRPTLIMDMGGLMNSLVGQSEANIRQALQIVDAMAPAVVMIDEVEKALSGAASSGQTDSGVSARMFGTFLTWLNDHASDVFVVATCNDISKLPPEFSRAERFDGVFFLDLPSQQQREAIWNIHLQQFAIATDQPRPVDTDWTGAEIKACCRLAALLDLPLQEAAKNVVPIARTAEESVSRLRSWAQGRCLDAERGGIYRGSAAPGGSGRRRRLSTDPSAN